MWSKLTSWLSSCLLDLTAPIVSRIFAALGVGATTFTGLKMSYDQINSYLHNQFGGVTADIADLLSMAGFGVALTIILSAWLMRLTFTLFLNPLGSITKLFLK